MSDEYEAEEPEPPGSSRGEHPDEGVESTQHEAEECGFRIAASQNERHHGHGQNEIPASASGDKQLEGEEQPRNQALHGYIRAVDVGDEITGSEKDQSS